MMADEYIPRKAALKAIYTSPAPALEIQAMPAADVVEIPDSGIGELSDGYHTFNGLYYQRMVLFAALVNAYNDKAWKSWRHEDGKPCFDGGWFIVGIDTPKGSYTYHYEDKYWNWFECEELPTAKHWDGHTEEDVTRLLTLAADVVEVVRCRDCKHRIVNEHFGEKGYMRLKAMCELDTGDPFELGRCTEDDNWFCADGERKNEKQDGDGE